ncbi:MAG: hypothetical protein PHC97_01790 [Patescibacteria group bacterium]|nr:hypothetical protein [Patescibacteria group bacterium]
MKKIIIGFVSALVIIGLGTIIYYFVMPRELGSLQNIDLKSSGPTASNQPINKTQESNDYKILKTTDFEVKYPNWQNIDVSTIPDAKYVKVAVSNQRCVLIIKGTPLPANTSYKDYIEGIIKQSGAALKINSQQINSASAYLDGDVTSGQTILRNISYSYLAKSNVVYGLAFVSEKSVFENYCRETIENVINSVIVK